MTISSKFFNKFFYPIMALSLVFAISSCDKDDDDMDTNPNLKSVVYNYEFNNGQVVPAAAYDGMHSDNLSAELKIEEMSNGGSRITVSLMNTVDGEMYPVHTHDAADPATTPNGTPYNEAPNASILVKTVAGNGGTASVSQETSMSYTELTSNYEGFFVVHDPLQAVDVTDISTYLVVGSFAREQQATGFKSMSYEYEFNTGQIAPAFAYSGTHPTDLKARLSVSEVADGSSRVQVQIMNTVNGEIYRTHAHDKADPGTTPNGTPYNEVPNIDVMVKNINGNGGTAYGWQFSSKSYAEITGSYEAFFVIHDPLQAMTTTDPTTYIILGNFARE